MKNAITPGRSISFLLLTCLLLIASSFAFSQDTLRSYTATRLTRNIKVDGILDSAEWSEISAAGNFIQNQPFEGKPASFKTEVRICYDNHGIYVAAMMFDPSPDSILHELGIRDAQGINADQFRLLIDPYNKRQDAFEFGVWASGVQIDSKFTDPTFDAVWHSATKINEHGWTAEMMIPYSAIRFPETKEQLWGLQFTRTIRRTREFTQFALTPNVQANPLRFFANLKGISDIEPPLRLSFTPFLSYAFSNQPLFDGNKFIYFNSNSYTAGADVKYGIDDRFTLDLTLFPDFGQVQSDRRIKTLGYQEITYAENRAFFKEGTELFNKGNLFYSRRIGKTPSGYYSIPFSISNNERIVANPNQVRLLNAAKLSGRTNNGLGIGFFNALTDHTYAIIEDSVGTRRKELTEPLTNYNILVLDQQMDNNNNIYFINTNVTRAGLFSDANVTGTGFKLYNKKSTWAIQADGVLTQKFSRPDPEVPVFTDQVGYSYFAGFGKVSGNFLFSAWTRTGSRAYDARDLGYFSINNYRTYAFEPEYNIYTPNKYLRNSFNFLSITYREFLPNHKRSAMNIEGKSFNTLHNFHSVFVGGGTSPFSNFDYYEPRLENRFYKTAQYFYIFYGISSDYRKKLAVDLTVSNSWFYKNHHGSFPNYPGHNLNATIRYRFNDHLTVSYINEFGIDPYNPGFATIDSSAVIFGGRKLLTHVNGIILKYIFIKDMMLTANVRHYWNTGEYIDYYTLNEDGNLTKNPYNYNLSYSTNFFNVDVVYSWIFLPGSTLSLVYKNAIEEDTQLSYIRRFNENLKQTFDLPQTNTISLRMVYFLDYQNIRRMKKLKVSAHP